MKRLLILSFLLWVTVLFWSSTAYAVITTASEAEAWSMCSGWVTEQSAGGGTGYACSKTANNENEGNWVWGVKGGWPYEQWTYPPGTGCTAPDVMYEVEPGVFACGTPPPECETPNYIDVVSGECVAPEEICFTTIESMANECVYIGEDDPNDEVPDGCAINEQTGKEFCISEEEGCYEVDGDTVCPTPDMVCGVKNDAFSCVAPQEEGCGYFNGELVCFDPDGEKVENDSPDHPDNGGNLDGDETNDVTDSRDDETEGGDPNNQPGEIPETQPGDEATEATARKNLQENKKTAENTEKSAESLEDIKETLDKEKLENQDEITGSIDQASADAIAETGVDDHISGIGDSEIGTDAVGDSGTTLKNALPADGSCTELRTELIEGKFFEISCEDTSRLREVLSWVFYISTVWYLFNLVTNPPTKGLK